MNEVYRKLVMQMAQVDQDLRLSAKSGRGPLNYLIYAIDAVHLFRLLELIKAYGYPTKRSIGEEGMKKFWILVQHQDMDIEFQKQCLRHCVFAPYEKAHLIDRVLMGEGKPQRYGTQSHRDARGRRVLWLVANPKQLNARRKKMGLSAIK